MHLVIRTSLSPSFLSPFQSYSSSSLSKLFLFSFFPLSLCLSHYYLSFIFFFIIPLSRFLYKLYQLEFLSRKIQLILEVGGDRSNTWMRRDTWMRKETEWEWRRHSGRIWQGITNTVTEKKTGKKLRMKNSITWICVCTWVVIYSRGDGICTFLYTL